MSTDQDADGDVTTDADGHYSMTIALGNYQFSYNADFFVSELLDVSVLAGTSVEDVALTPEVPVVVLAESSGEAIPGETLPLTATVIPLDGSTLQSFNWSVSNGVDATIAVPGAELTELSLPDVRAYKDGLFEVLAHPPLAGSDDDSHATLPDCSGVIEKFSLSASYSMYPDAACADNHSRTYLSVVPVVSESFSEVIGPFAARDL